MKYVFFKFYVPLKMSSRTPGVRITQVEYHCLRGI
jgi:hypothetical protein